MTDKSNGPFPPKPAEYPDFRVDNPLLRGEFPPHPDEPVRPGLVRAIDRLRDSQAAFDAGRAWVKDGFVAAPGYELLVAILADAHNQAAVGKGKERHQRGDTPFDRQPICEIARMTGIGYNTGQAMKKAQEAMGMLTRGEPGRARAELLGAINYLAAAVIVLDETAE